MGYKFQFITLAGFRPEPGMFELAPRTGLSGMSAYSPAGEGVRRRGVVRVQAVSIALLGRDISMVTQGIASGNTSTTALAGSTDAEQFAPGGGPAETGAESKPHGEEHSSVPIILPEVERTRVRL
jgi:isocitrate lyase